MLPIRLYRTLLWCYPASFRREYGAEMVGSFAEQVRDPFRTAIAQWRNGNDWVGYDGHAHAAS